MLLIILHFLYLLSDWNSNCNRQLYCLFTDVPKTLRNLHTNTQFKRQTSTSCIIKNEYELAFLSTKSGFTLYYLSKETVCKHVIIYITSFQTLPTMHNLHYLKNTYTLPHSNCEHIKNMFSLQPANQHNNSYKKNSCHGKYKTNVHCSLSLKRTQPNLSLCCL